MEEISETDMLHRRANISFGVKKNQEKNQWEVWRCVEPDVHVLLPGRAGLGLTEGPNTQVTANSRSNKQHQAGAAICRSAQRRRRYDLC